MKVLESKACKPACTGTWGSGHTSGVSSHPAHIHGKQEAAEEHTACRGHQVSTEGYESTGKGNTGSQSPGQGHLASWTSAPQQGRPQWPFIIRSMPFKVFPATISHLLHSVNVELEGFSKLIIGFKRKKKSRGNAITGIQFYDPETSK